MDSVTEVFIGSIRYILAIMGAIIVFRSVLSLIKNRPRIHKMAQLVMQDGSSIEINHWETSIGRSKSNDITLNASTVSRFHAVIAKKKQDWFVTDTFSKTGITINGKSVEKRCELEDGDVIAIGGVPLVFQCAEAISRQSKNQIRNTVRQGTNVAYAVLVDSDTHRPVYIKKKDVLIGRGDQCDLRIPSEMVSSEHARIHETSRGWALSDLDSHNGTKLNGRYISQPQLIFDEDTITFGDRVFIFYDK